MTALAPTLQLFFTERLARQRQASPQTVPSYRNTFRLLLRFVSAAHRQGPPRPGPRRPQRRDDRRVPGPPGRHRHNTARTRNARLAAIRSLFRYAALRHPEHAPLIQRVLAIPPTLRQRPRRFLTPARPRRCWPPRTRPLGRPPRPRPARSSPPRPGCGSPSSPGSPGDIHLGAGPHVRCTGKGRKERCTPLTAHRRGPAGLAKRTRRPARRPAVPHQHPAAAQPRRRRRLVAMHTARRAAIVRPWPAKTRHPAHAAAHRRHALLHAGVDIAVIALWLGHEHPTQPRSTCTPT